MFVQDLLDDRGAVPMADLEKDLLEHRPVTTFLRPIWCPLTVP